VTTLPEFQNFLRDLQALIHKYNGSDPTLLTKDQRTAAAARATLPVYKKQFALITDYIANALELSPGLIDQSTSRCRFARVAWARHLCMMFCDELTSASQSAIAHYYGCPSHGGVGYARRNVQASTSAYKEEAAFVDRLRIELKECLLTAEAMSKAREHIPPVRADKVGPALHQRDNKTKRNGSVSASVPSVPSVVKKS
jgi:hypothetical protein